MRKRMIILLIIAVLAISGGVLFFFNQNTHTEPPTDSDYDINSLKHAITTAIASSDINRPERFIQLSTNVEVYDKSWITVPVTFLDELPDSYDREYIFIIRKTSSSLQVVSYQPPGWFSNEDIPDDAPEMLKEVILGDAHGE